MAGLNTLYSDEEINKKKCLIAFLRWRLNMKLRMFRELIGGADSLICNGLYEGNYSEEMEAHLHEFQYCSDHVLKKQLTDYDSHMEQFRDQGKEIADVYNTLHDLKHKEGNSTTSPEEINRLKCELCANLDNAIKKILETFKLLDDKQNEIYKYVVSMLFLQPE